MQQNMITIRNLSKEFKGQKRSEKHYNGNPQKLCIWTFGGKRRGKIHAVENNHRIVKPYVR